MNVYIITNIIINDGSHEILKNVSLLFQYWTKPDHFSLVIFLYVKKNLLIFQSIWISIHLSLTLIAYKNSQEFMVSIIRSLLTVLPSTPIRFSICFGQRFIFKHYRRLLEVTFVQIMLIFYKTLLDNRVNLLACWTMQILLYWL